MAFCRNAVWIVLISLLAPSSALKVGIHWDAGLTPTLSPGESQRYLIASFPKDFKISYARLPDPTWRPLVVRNLSNPSVLAVDEQNKRLFVADPTANKIWWYQLQVTEPSKFLITDGVQRLAATNIVAKGLAVSQAGDLLIAGRIILASGGRSAIYKQEASTFETGDVQSPKRLWTAGDGSWLPKMLETGLPSMSEPMSPSTPELFQPGAVAVDMFTVYWGNLIKSNASAALASAPATVPMPRPGGAVPKVKAGARALASSFQSVTGIAMTSSGMFFAGRPKEGLPGIFALPNQDVTSGCSEDDRCIRRVAQVGNALSLCWDGDSTLFIADGGRGAVVALPSATASRHDVEKIADARGVRAIAMLSVTNAGSQVAALSVIGMLIACLTNLL